MASSSYFPSLMEMGGAPIVFWCSNHRVPDPYICKSSAEPEKSRSTIIEMDAISEMILRHIPSLCAEF